MDETWRTILWQQFGAAIDMLGNAMEAREVPGGDRSPEPDPPAEDRFRPRWVAQAR